MADSEIYKRAYERERMARQAAEKLLDEKSREVYSSLNLIKSQFQQLSDRKNNLELLVAVATFTQDQMSFADSLSSFVKIIGSFTESPYIIVYDLHNARDHSKLNILRWPEDEFPEAINNLLGTQYLVDTNPIFLAARQSGHPLIIDKENLDAITQHADIYEALNINGVVALPVTCYNEVVAIIEIAVNDWDRFPDSLVESAIAATTQLSVALERRASHKNLEENHQKLKQTLDELKRTQSQLVHSEKLASIGQLAAGVAHEINNPIGFVLSNINTLSEYIGNLTSIIEHTTKTLEKLPDSATALRQSLDEFKTEADYDYITKDIGELLSDSTSGLLRVKDIVSNLKNFARTDEGHMENADINRCLENTIKVVWNEIKYKCDVEKDLGDIPAIQCNADQLGQVFLNLIVNANQAIEKKGVISIRTRMENDHIVIRIADNGCGIPEDKIKHIFDPFFTTKPVGVGTGLGLSIAYGIIEKHHGSIEVETAIGKGTTFIIRLPANLGDASYSI